MAALVVACGIASIGATRAHAADCNGTRHALSGGTFTPACGTAPPPCNPSITAPTTLPDASENVRYTYKVPGCGTLSLTHGTLPQGLSLIGSNTIGGSTAGDPIQTAALTLTMSSNGQTVSENVELPVTKTYTVDPNGGELTGATNDGNLVYVAGPKAGDVFDLDTANPPAGSGTALTGLNFPAAVAAARGHLFGAQFRAPESAGAPVAVGSAPASTATAPSVGAPLADGDTSCAKPDAVAASTVSSSVADLAYSCAGSNQVQEELSFATGPVVLGSFSLGSNGVPSGIAFVNSTRLVVADARNSTVSLVGFNPGPNVLATIGLPSGAKPANVAYDAANGTVYVADPGTGQVSQVTVNVNAGTLTDTGEIKVGSRPYGVAVNDSGNELVVTNSGDGTADVISLSGTPTISYTPTVGSTPDGVTIVGSEAYIADEQGGTVTVIDPPSKGLRRKLTITHVHRAKKKSATHKKRRTHQHARRAQPAVARQASIDPLVAPLPR